MSDFDHRQRVGGMWDTMGALHDFGVRFDFALAQSVFTHIHLNGIRRCPLNVGRVLADDGVFFATFFHNPNTAVDDNPITVDADDVQIVAHVDRNPFCYELDAFERAYRGTGLGVEHFGRAGTPASPADAQVHAGMI